MSYVSLALTTLMMIFLSACSHQETQTVTGTLVLVKRKDLPACEAGLVKIQPMANIGSEAINIGFQDMTLEREEMLKKYLGKQIEISISQTTKMFGCDSAQVQVLAKTGE
jgi:hypothetical protein